jgi:iron complex transport system permease protein
MRYPLVLIALLLLLATGVAAGLAVGQGSLHDPATRAVFLELRALRMGCAALAGAALAVAGTVMQGLFRNPLASPSVLGTTAGASLGGQVVLLAHGLAAAWLPLWLAPEMLLPLGCVLGAILALAVLVLASGPTLGLSSVLLTGVIMTSLFGSVSAFLVVIGQNAWELGRAMVAFSLGSVDAKGLRHVLMAAPLVLTGTAATWAWGRSLDVMLAGEDEAAALGVDVHRLKRWALIWSAVLTGAAVAVGGGVAFVGLIVPHVLRPFIGVSHRRLIPAAAIGGAAFLVWCDVLARAIPAQGELPLGVITGFIGAPVFLGILIKARREGRI